MFHTILAPGKILKIMLIFKSGLSLCLKKKSLFYRITFTPLLYNMDRLTSKNLMCSFSYPREWSLNFEAIVKAREVMPLGSFNLQHSQSQSFVFSQEASLLCIWSILFYYFQVKVSCLMF